MSKRFDRDALLQMAHKDVKARYQALFGEPPRSPNKTWMVNQMEEEHARRKPAAKATPREAPAPTPTRGRRRPAESPGREDPAVAPSRVGEPGATLNFTALPAREEETLPSPSAEVREETPEPAPPAISPEGTPAAPPVGPSPHIRGRFRSMTIDELRARYAEVVGRPTSSFDKGYLVWKIREAEKGKIRVGPVEPGQRREGALAGADKTLPLTLSAQAVEAMDAAWARTGFTSRMSFMRTALREALASRGEGAAAALFPEKGAQ